MPLCRRILSRCVLLLLALHTYPLHAAAIRMGTEYRLPADHECLGYGDVLRAVLSTHVSLPLVSHDAFAALQPGLAEQWWHTWFGAPCFALDTNRTFSDGTPVTAASIAAGLADAIALHKESLGDLREYAQQISQPSPGLLCLPPLPRNKRQTVFELLSMPLAAPVRRTAQKCHYAGDFLVQNSSLLHRPTGRSIAIVPLQSPDALHDFLMAPSGMSIFTNVQLQIPSADMLQSKRIHFIPDRGAARTAFLFSHRPLSPRRLECLQESLRDNPWPFPHAMRAGSFLPQSIIGQKVEASHNLHTDPVRIHSVHMRLATSHIYNDPQIASWVIGVFRPCGIALHIDYYDKINLEYRFRDAEITADLLLTSVGMLYPDPRPLLALYFGQITTPHAKHDNNRPIFPLIDSAPHPSPAPLSLHEHLLQWESAVMQSRQIIPVAHFTAYTIISAPQKSVDCLPKQSSPSSSLPLGCLLAQ